MTHDIDLGLLFTPPTGDDLLRSWMRNINPSPPDLQALQFRYGGGGMYCAVCNLSDPVDTGAVFVVGVQPVAIKAARPPYVPVAASALRVVTLHREHGVLRDDCFHCVRPVQQLRFGAFFRSDETIIEVVPVRPSEFALLRETMRRPKKPVHR